MNIFFMSARMLVTEHLKCLISIFRLQHSSPTLMQHHRQKRPTIRTIYNVPTIESILVNFILRFADS